MARIFAQKLDVGCSNLFLRETVASRFLVRHIPLNESHETIDSLYRTGTEAELEQTLRSWLLCKIKQLEEEQMGKQPL